MKNTWFQLALIAVFLVTTAAACEIPKEQFTAAVAERDTTLAKLQTANSEIENLRVELQSTGILLNQAKLDTQAANDNMAQTKVQLQSTAGELDKTRIELETTRGGFQLTKANLQSMNASLQSANLELNKSNNELLSVRTQLQSTLAEFKATNATLQSLNASLQTTQANLRSAQANLTAALNANEQQLKVINKAKCYADIAAVIGTAFADPQADVLQLFSTMADNVKSADDPMLQSKYFAVMNSGGAGDETIDFLLYVWQALPKVLGPLSVPAGTKSAAPVLIFPARGTVMDNGRGDFKDSIVWMFDWEDVPGATMYELYVNHPGATVSMIDVSTPNSWHRNTSDGYIADANRFGWTWQVRALVNGQWSEWSELRAFDVEPLNTDPPA